MEIHWNNQIIQKTNLDLIEVNFYSIGVDIQRDKLFWSLQLSKDFEEISLCYDFGQNLIF